MNIDYRIVTSDFERNFSRLRDWPERKVINDLTAFLDHNYNFAASLVDIIIAKLVSPTTNQAFKVPVFYLIDSIITKIKDPYVQIFTPHIIELFKITYEFVIKYTCIYLDFFLL